MNYYPSSSKFKGLVLDMIDIDQIILKYICISDTQRLKYRHIESFINEACQASMNELKNIKMPEHKLNRWAYETSRAFDQVLRGVNKNHPHNLKFKEFKVLN